MAGTTMKLFTILFALLLSSCAAYDAVVMTNFDANEYQMITKIRVDSSHFKNSCDDPTASRANATTLAQETELFAAYSEHLPHNGDGYRAAQELDAMAQGLGKQYQTSSTVSTLFCKLKFEGVEHSANTIQHVLGKRPR